MDSLQIVKMLIKAGADTNLARFYDGETPLHIAIYHKNSEDIIKILLEFDADPRVKNIFGQTPLKNARKT